MNTLLRLSLISPKIGITTRNFSVTGSKYANYSCKLLVVGGGSGGVSMAAKFARRLGKGSVVVLEPSSNHYYQPLWTLVGAGIKRLADSHAYEHAVLPAKAQWIKDFAETIDPRACKVTTRQGDVINYEYIIVAVGLNTDYSQVPGLAEALEDPHSSVSTIYDPRYCEKTWADFQKFKGGDALFTFPTTATKCPGAPQKITYLADAYFRKTGVRSKSRLYYNTPLNVIFGVKKYADILEKVVERKQINVNYKTTLAEVRHERREADFISNVDNTKSTVSYDMLHVSPPMKVPDLLSNNEHISGPHGFLHVDKFTLQHVHYKNMYGIGDCINTPNSKTAAAVSKQTYVLEQNLLATMQNDSPRLKYNGYGACPLVTSYRTCVMAEFLYDGVVWETFPLEKLYSFDSSVHPAESRIGFLMKKHLFPLIYWHGMVRGRYHGPEWCRNIFNPEVWNKSKKDNQCKTKVNA